MAKLFITLFLVSALVICTILGLENEDNELDNGSEGESGDPEESLDKKEVPDSPGNNKYMKFRRGTQRLPGPPKTNPNKYSKFRRGTQRLPGPPKTNPNKYSKFRRDVD